MKTLPCLSVWPEWELTEYLGGGAYGEVYRAVRTDSGVTSEAAVKIIRVPGDTEELSSLRMEGIDREGTDTYLKQIVSSFTGEIQIMESFKGAQNIVSIEDYKVVKNGEGYEISIRMELLTPLNTYLDNGQMTEREILQLGIDLTNALDICARRNIIHRDIKPENVFINRFGDFKLGDFGVARSLENRSSRMSAKGTYNYMAPEVAQNRVYDSRADIYSLGIMLYRLANGNRLPFLSDRQLLSPQERQFALERRLNGALLPAPSNASPALARIILKACSFLPEERYGSAAEMRRELTALMRSSTEDGTVTVRHAKSEENVTVSVPRAGRMAENAEPTYEEPKKKRGKVLAFVIGGVLLAALLCALILHFIGVWDKEDADEEEPESTPAAVAELAEEAEPAQEIVSGPAAETAAGLTPEPTTALTPEPAPKSPSAADLNEIGAAIVYPKDNQYLPDYVSVIVNPPRGTEVYAYTDPDDITKRTLLPEMTEGIAIAEYRGLSCVLFPAMGKAAWVNYNYLVTGPYTPGSGSPSAKDLDDAYSHIGYPREEQYFSAYKAGYIHPQSGDSVYAFSDLSKGTRAFYFLVPSGTELVAIAQSKGYVCVILVEDGRTAWINADYIVFN